MKARQLGQVAQPVPSRETRCSERFAQRNMRRRPRSRYGLRRRPTAIPVADGSDDKVFGEPGLQVPHSLGGRRRGRRRVCAAAHTPGAAVRYGQRNRGQRHGVRLLGPAPTVRDVRDPCDTQPADLRVAESQEERARFALQQPQLGVALGHEARDQAAVEYGSRKAEAPACAISALSGRPRPRQRRCSAAHTHPSLQSGCRCRLTISSAPKNHSQNVNGRPGIASRLNAAHVTRASVVGAVQRRPTGAKQRAANPMSSRDALPGPCPRATVAYR